MLVSSYDAIDTRSILVYRAITCILSLAGVTFLTSEDIDSPSPEDIYIIIMNKYKNSGYSWNIHYLIFDSMKIRTYIVLI
jgi:hypothetical protein